MGGLWSHLGAGAVARGDELATLGAREAEPARVRGLAESAVDFVLLLLVTRLGKIVLVENVPGNLLRQCEETRVGAAPFGRLGRLLHLEVESLVIGDAMITKLPKRQTGAHEDESRARHGHRVRRDAAVFFLSSRGPDSFPRDQLRRPRRDVSSRRRNRRHVALVSKRCDATKMRARDRSRPIARLVVAAARRSPNSIFTTSKTARKEIFENARSPLLPRWQSH